LFLDFPAYLFDFTGSGIAKLNSDSLGDAESVLRWPASSGTSLTRARGETGHARNESYQKKERLGDLVSAT